MAEKDSPPSVRPMSGGRRPPGINPGMNILSDGTRLGFRSGLNFGPNLTVTDDPATGLVTDAD